MVDRDIVYGIAFGLLATGFSSALFLVLGANNLEAMKSIIDADAALIGFLAVVLVFLFSETQGERRRLVDDLERIVEKHNDYIKKGSVDDEEIRKFRDKETNLTKYLKSYTTFSGSALNNSLQSATFFVFSIFMALLGMSDTSVVRYFGSTSSIFGIITGIALLFNVLSVFKNVQTKYGERIEVIEEVVTSPKT